MTPDLTYLVWTCVLAIVQTVVAAVGAIGMVGLPALAGNRDNLPTIEGWAGRAGRAHRNLLETLVIFAVLVFAAHLAGRANATTALGAATYFWARVAYAIVYAIGIPWLRTGLFAVSLIGLGMILSQLT